MAINIFSQRPQQKLQYDELYKQNQKIATGFIFSAFVNSLWLFCYSFLLTAQQQEESQAIPQTNPTIQNEEISADNKIQQTATSQESHKGKGALSKKQNSQKEKIRRSDLYIGFLISSGISADAIFSNLYKVQTLLGANLGYTYNGNLMRHNIRLQGGAGWLHSPYKPAGEVFGEEYPQQIDFPIDLELGYRLAFSIWKNQYIQFRLGPGYHFITNLWLGTNADWYRYTWRVHTGIGLQLFLGIQPSPRHKISISLYMPAIGIGWRAPYTGYTSQVEQLLETQGVIAAVFSTPYFYFFHNSIEANVQATYQFRLLQFMSLLTDYQFKISYTTANRKRLELQHYVTLGVSFHF